MNTIINFKELVISALDNLNYVRGFLHVIYGHLYYYWDLLLLLLFRKNVNDPILVYKEIKQKINLIDDLNNNNFCCIFKGFKNKN